MKKKLPKKLDPLKKEELTKVSGGRRPQGERQVAFKFNVSWDDIILRSPVPGTVRGNNNIMPTKLER